MIEIPCPICNTKAHPTKEESTKKYLWCWLCSLDFLNPNYVEEKDGKIKYKQ